MATENTTSLLKALERNGLKTLSDPEHLNADPEGAGRGKGWYVTLEGPNGPETVHLGLSTEIAMATAMGRKRGGLVGGRNPARVKSAWKEALGLAAPVVVGGLQGTLDGYLTDQGRDTHADIAQTVLGTVGLAAALKSSNPVVKQMGITTATVAAALEGRRHIGPAISRKVEERRRTRADKALEEDWAAYEALMRQTFDEKAPEKAPEKAEQQAQVPVPVQ